MKIKRIVASDMSKALKKVRAELGPDAVILSERIVEGGIEIVSAIDYDGSLIPSRKEEATLTKERFEKFKETDKHDMFANANTGKSVGASASVPHNMRHLIGDDFEDDVVSLTSTRAPAPEKPSSAPITKVSATERELFDEPPAQQAAAPAKKGNEFGWEEISTITELKDEIRTLRGLFKDQLSVLEWGGMAKRNPVRASLLKRLSAMGLSHDICRRIADRLAECDDLGLAWKKAISMLVRTVKVTNDDILDYGGVIALVGPTGVGKTTTIAKLAARYSLRHGRGQVGLITTDTYRIGAQDQLRSFGRILGVPVHVASDADELNEVVHSLADKPLVLIDSAGLSPRDVKLAERVNHLNLRDTKVKTYMVMSGNTQAASLNEVFNTLGDVDVSGAILTKLDESANLGGALTTLLRHSLPVAYVTNGQRVPEDIHPARAEALIDRAEQLIDTNEYDDECLALAFSKGEH